MKRTILIFSSIFLLTHVIACMPSIKNHSTVEIKIVRILSPVEAEIISNGSLQVISLAGVSFIPETDIREKYLNTGKIDKKFEVEILEKLKEATLFFSSNASQGDTLYAIDITKDPEIYKIRQMIIYSPDMVSINEKMVRAGCGFPGMETASVEFDAMIKKSMNKAIEYRRGLWRIGEIITLENAAK